MNKAHLKERLLYYKDGVVEVMSFIGILLVIGFILAYISYAGV